MIFFAKFIIWTFLLPRMLLIGVEQQPPEPAACAVVEFSAAPGPHATEFPAVALASMLAVAWLLWCKFLEGGDRHRSHLPPEVSCRIERQHADVVDMRKAAESMGYAVHSESEHGVELHDLQFRASVAACDTSTCTLEWEAPLSFTRLADAHELNSSSMSSPDPDPELLERFAVLKASAIIRGEWHCDFGGLDLASATRILEYQEFFFTARSSAWRYAEACKQGRQQGYTESEFAVTIK